MAVRTHTVPRVFTRADGRDRIAVPFWNGILSFIATIAIGFAAAFVAAIVLTVVIVLATGNTPSLTPGHPLMAATELILYASGGWFAYHRLRTTGIRAFRRLTGADVRTIFIGIGALMLVRIGLGIQLVLTQQTKHAQAGFEHFDVVTKTPALTAVTATLAVITLVAVAPFIEEILFRGLLFGAFAPKLGVIASAVGTAVIFGASHGDSILFPTLAALGIITALAYAATANLWVPITLHAINNALGAAFLIGSSLTHH